MLSLIGQLLAVAPQTHATEKGVLPLFIMLKKEIGLIACREGSQKPEGHPSIPAIFTTTRRDGVAESRWTTIRLEPDQPRKMTKQTILRMIL